MTPVNESRVQKSRWNCSNVQRASMESGAFHSLIGMIQAKTYCRYFEIMFRAASSLNRYTVGLYQICCLGEMRILLLTVDSHTKETLM